jgi:hypothetical protein
LNVETDIWSLSKQVKSLNLERDDLSARASDPKPLNFGAELRSVSNPIRPLKFGTVSKLDKSLYFATDDLSSDKLLNFGADDRSVTSEPGYDENKSNWSSKDNDGSGLLILWLTSPNAGLRRFLLVKGSDKCVARLSDKSRPVGGLRSLLLPPDVGVEPPTESDRNDKKSRPLKEGAARLKSGR